MGQQRNVTSLTIRLSKFNLTKSFQHRNVVKNLMSIACKPLFIPQKSSEHQVSLKFPTLVRHRRAT